MDIFSSEARLASIDLSRVMGRVAKEIGWDGPTLDHAHVLHTRQYAADCELLFGQFLHHEPSSADTTGDFEARTLPAFAETFGIDLRAAGCGGDVRADCGMALPTKAARCGGGIKARELTALSHPSECARSPIDRRSRTVTHGPMAAPGGCQHNPLFGAGDCN